jgi:hypothetical protein
LGARRNIAAIGTQIIISRNFNHASSQNHSRSLNTTEIKEGKPHNVFEASFDW